MVTASVLGLCLLCSGCDSVTRHKVLSTIFDGVPSLPPTDQLCEQYYLDRKAAEEQGQQLQLEQTAGTSQRSVHLPYGEKKCQDCHSDNKNVNDGLIAPKQKLCAVCHTELIQGINVHGPVAVGDCLACHLPHSANQPALLKEDPEKICATCHQEARLAGAMHQRFESKELHCGECHDPHAGDARYFLK
jgi:predicted CXXCH cytochrome family protein